MHDVNKLDWNIADILKKEKGFKLVAYRMGYYFQSLKPLY